MSSRLLEVQHVAFRKTIVNFVDPAATQIYLTINFHQTLAHTLAAYPEVLINLSGDFYAKVCN